MTTTSASAGGCTTAREPASSDLPRIAGAGAERDSLAAVLRADIRRLSRPLRPLQAGERGAERASVKAERGPVRGIRGVLFDVYGTLLTATGEGAGGAGGTEGAGGGGDAADAAGAATSRSGAKAASLGQALAAAGVAAETDPAELVRRFEAAIAAHHRRARAQGIAWPEVDQRVLWADLLPGAAAAAVQRVAVGYECRITPVWPMPSAAQVIAALQRSGIAVGIVSNAQFYTPLVLEALLPEVGVDPRLTVWSFEQAEAKPSPRLFAAAAERMAAHHGLRPRHLLMVGNDLRNDVWAAQRAGLYAALFAGDGRSLLLRRDDPCCRDLRPDLVLDALTDLLPALHLTPAAAPAAD